MSFRPVEVGSVDRPDHPSLRDSGCFEKTRGAFVYSFLGGSAFGAAWGAAAGYKNKQTGVILLRTIGRGAWVHGSIIGAVTFAVFAAQCY